MNEIDKYESYKTLAIVIIVIACEVAVSFICVCFDSGILVFGAGLAIALFGCFLMIIFDNIFDKKIKKYKEEHGKELSQESSQL